jgi:predicted transcriptional regulator
MSEMVKFSSQVDAEILGKVRDIAKAEGRQLQALLDEALRDLVEKKTSAKPRSAVMDAYRSTLGQFDAVYRHLAK